MSRDSKLKVVSSSDVSDSGLSIARRADLLISQDLLERKVSQMSFLIKFYELTRFMLERERIASEFLKLSCQQLGFETGFFFSVDQKGARVDAAHDQEGGSETFDSLRRIVPIFDGPKRSLPPLGNAPPGSVVTVPTSIEFLGPNQSGLVPLKSLYQEVGILEVVNSVRIKLATADDSRLELHLVNWEHGPELDPSTKELIETMKEPLEATFSTASLYQASITDELTQLKNRRYFQICLERDIAEQLKKDGSLSMIMIDVDRFKNVNEVFGPKGGDFVLKKIAGVLRSNLRRSTTIARWGGEEFAILLPGVNGENAFEIADKLRRAIALEKIYFGDRLITCTASLGVATVPDHCVRASALVEAAELAMYAAKHQGRNQVQVASRSAPIG